MEPEDTAMIDGRLLALEKLARAFAEQLRKADSQAAKDLAIRIKGEMLPLQGNESPAGMTFRNMHDQVVSSVIQSLVGTDGA